MVDGESKLDTYRGFVSIYWYPRKKLSRVKLTVLSFYESKIYRCTKKRAGSRALHPAQTIPAASRHTRRDDDCRERPYPRSAQTHLARHRRIPAADLRPLDICAAILRHRVAGVRFELSAEHRADL